MSRHDPELTDEQWNKIAPLLPKAPPTRRGGRPRVEDQRCFEGILWVLRSGARWKDLPAQYPSPSTCWRRLRDWEETFADGSFVPAKKGVPASERPNAARVRSGWWWQAARVFLWEFNLPVRRRTKRR